MFRTGQLVRIKSAAEIMSYPEAPDGGWNVGHTYFNSSMLFYCGGYATISGYRGNNRYELSSAFGIPGGELIRRWHWDEEMLEPAFKVGTRVRIKDWENAVRDAPAFVPLMRHLCGRYATIERIEGNRLWLKDWSNTEGDLVWRYDIDMVEPIMPITVSVDFDGTITKSAEHGQEGFNVLRENCKESMDYLSKRGVSFYLLTARQEYLQEAIDLCKEWDLPICTTNPTVKKITNWYIEDRAVGVGNVNWAEIKNFFDAEIKKQRGE